MKQKIVIFFSGILVAISATVLAQVPIEEVAVLSDIQIIDPELRLKVSEIQASSTVSNLDALKIYEARENARKIEEQVRTNNDLLIIQLRLMK